MNLQRNCNWWKPDARTVELKTVSIPAEARRGRLSSMANRAKEEVAMGGEPRYVSRAGLTHFLLAFLTALPVVLQSLDKLPTETEEGSTLAKSCFGADGVARATLSCLAEVAKANLVTIWTSTVLVMTASAAVYAGAWR